MTLAAFALAEHIAAQAQAHLLRSPTAVSHGITPCITLKGREYLNFSSNDYLGLAGHPALNQACMAYLKQANVSIGSGAAHLVTGHTVLHEQLENRLAQLTGCARAMLFSTGYMANVGVLDALVGKQAKNTVIFQDKLNHASLLDGARLSAASLKRYAHGNMVQLETLLQHSSATRKIIASDLVFSMDGSEAPLAALRALADKYNAALMLDDAHGFGLRTTPLPPVDIYMATLGKAIGTFGAFVAGSDTLIDFLQSSARTYCFTTASPPLMAAATLAALDVIASTPTLQQQLQRNIHQLRQGLAAQGWQLPAEASCAIQPIIIGDVAATLQLAANLRAHGFMVVAIRPPTVPVGSSRLRITVSAAHTEAHIHSLLACLAQAYPSYGARQHL